tara:strand:+ start:2159 stop:2887 length:729 start_codon:yes stop_codon:yes gene_type:complete
MDNALENENLDNQGQVTDNVGQDESQTQNTESENDWESQAKYHQSEKDKLYSENQKLKQYEQIGNMLESRPDIVNTITGMLKGGQPAQAERITLEKDDFDPWEAYNDPASKSYKFRQQELQDSINDAVQGQMAGVQKQVGMNELKGQLQAKGLNDQEINSFIEFASKNPAEYGIDGAINMWKSVSGQPAQEGDNNNPLDSIRQNQAIPQQGGVLTGEQPARTDAKDDMWKAIQKAGSRANVL